MQKMKRAYHNMEHSLKTHKWGNINPPHFCPTFFARFLKVSYCILKVNLVEAAGIEPAFYPKNIII